MHDALIFDLDGTLWDTSVPCAVSWNNVLRREGISFRIVTADDVRSVTGLSHAECIRRVFHGLPDAQMEALIRGTIEEDNRVIADLGGDLYEGVREGLASLRERYRLYIVSNCQSGYIETFLKTSDLGSCFSDHECWGNTGLSKSENLSKLIARNDLRVPLFVGDMVGDHIAARDNGVPFAFVEYGFGECPDAQLRFATFSDFVHWACRPLGVR